MSFSNTSDDDRGVDGPGQIAFTRMPSGESSSASARVSMVSPPLAAEYAVV